MALDEMSTQTSYTDGRVDRDQILHLKLEQYSWQQLWAITHFYKLCKHEQMHASRAQLWCN